MLAVRSINALSGRDVDSVPANVKRWEQIEKSAPYGNVSNRSSTFRKLNLTDEIRGYNPDKVNEFLASEARSDRQQQNHHNCRTQMERIFFPKNASLGKLESGK